MGLWRNVSVRWFRRPFYVILVTMIVFTIWTFVDEFSGSSVMMKALDDIFISSKKSQITDKDGGGLSFRSAVEDFPPSLFRDIPPEGPDTGHSGQAETETGEEKEKEEKNEEKEEENENGEEKEEENEKGEEKEEKKEEKEEENENGERKEEEKEEENENGEEEENEKGEEKEEKNEKGEEKNEKREEKEEKNEKREEKIEEGEDVAQRFRVREDVYREACRGREEREGGPPKVAGLSFPFFYSPANFSVCAVPKVGVTFWKRIFFFLHHKTPKKKGSAAVKSPMDLDRTYVHFGAGLGPGMRVPPTDPALLSAWRIMFTRDPWARLWSAYVDKFVLPDSWMDLGRSIVRMRYRLSVQEALSLRKQSALERRVADSENSPLAFHVKDKMKCPDDITFSEFLRFVLSNNNAHWRPVSEVCDPCALRPHFLGKMETFGPDSAFIFNTTGLSDVLKLQLTHSTHVLDELQQLTAYHFQHVQRKGFSACLDYLGVARRLWRAFQLNGYIPTDLAFPEPFLESPLRKATRQEAESHVMERVRAAHSASPLGHQEWSALKRRHLVEVYRSVPRELLLRVQQRFSMDFQLFRYDEQPSDLFGE